MLASITAAFGLPIESGVISTIVSSTIGAAGAAVLGKTIVTGILKCIPGAGSVVVGVISGSVAVALTAALSITVLIRGAIVNHSTPFLCNFTLR